ncbi:hypothetical protein BN946_scf184577.g2 [Trametes cinnabarina]|uniref:Uncharacterized protein n=1 Tax=Pycnoporus cinnabarinus TaxID=5643 RepID=A0A060T0A0_PYCCI|nr:hypothetical protein BN946_scf184577.g2 [Trametes cinnabarina]
MPTMMSSHPRPVQRRTHQAKRKFALFTRAQAAPTPVPAPTAAPQFQWHEFKLLSLAEAQKREEIIYPPTWTTTLRAQLKIRTDSLGRTGREFLVAPKKLKTGTTLWTSTGVGEVCGGFGSPRDVSLLDNAQYSIPSPLPVAVPSSVQRLLTLAAQHIVSQRIKLSLNTPGGSGPGSGESERERKEVGARRYSQAAL